MCTQYMEHEPTTTSMREKGLHKQQMVAIEFSRRREYEPFASRMFVRLIVFEYKRARQSRRAVVIQSALCEVVCKENSRGLKVYVVSIIANSYVIRMTN